MKIHFLLVIVTAVVLPLAAAPATATADLFPIVIYQNDFDTRTSAGPIGSSGEVGPIGGRYAFDYSPGALIGGHNSSSGTQDGWIRRNSSGTTLNLNVVAGDNNQFVQIGNNTETHAYAVQKIGTGISEGPLRLSIDLLGTDNWQGQAAWLRGILVYLGNDAFYTSGSPNDTVLGFGIRRDGTEPNRFTVREGDQAGGAYVYRKGAADVDQHMWYRFIADLDLNSSTWALNVYELGTAQPAIDTAVGNLVFSSDAELGFPLGLRDNMASAGPITTVGLIVRGVSGSSIAGFDNIVLSVPEPSAWLLLAFGGLSVAAGRRRRFHT